ncbi:MAG: glycosyl transferase family 1 [Candidatus Dadabacteria bacterium]
MNIYFLTDVIESLNGSIRPPFLLAKTLREEFGANVTLICPRVNISIAEMLEQEDFVVKDLNKHYNFSGSLLTFEAWLRAFRLKRNESGIVINFSQCFIADAHVYYAQGPITKALEDMHRELKNIHKFIYNLVKPYLLRRDKAFNKELRQRSKVFVANSNFCASMYRDWGIKVDDVIYPPLDCNHFKPITSKPSGDYVLTYFGKETEYLTLEEIADAGVKIRAFGSKVSYLPNCILKNPNIEFLSRVSDEELITLYSNALYTLFTFTHEPFGYVPIESMACGTPVLTYNKQGPKETVAHNATGWLANNDELVKLAIKIWENGFPSWMRIECRKRALKFDVKVIANKWLEVLRCASGSLS